MFDPARIQITGPLAPHVLGLWSQLLALGYTPASGSKLLHLMAHLSRWLEGVALKVQDLTHERIEEFLEARRRSGYTQYLTRRALEAILQYLRTAGVLSLSEHRVPLKTAVDQLLYLYEQFLVQERALAESTVRHYQYVARHFLTGYLRHDSLDMSLLAAADVLSFVVRESRAVSVGYAQKMVTALRSLLRFLYLRGDLATDLTGAVPSVARWRLASLPKAFGPQEVRRLLQSCDRRTHLGRRDFAVLLLLVRLGLRAGEVAALKLDDIDWPQGEIVVRGKGCGHSRLPVPVDVGQAIVAYLRRSRPRATSRALFVRSRAPLRGLCSGAVSDIVRRAFARIDLPPAGAHRLRHTAATQMLRGGASLSEIAQVLRHQRLDTTALYAKVDRDGLRTVAQPWPGGVG